MPSNPYLQTLRRVPDDVILDMAARPIEINGPFTCVAAWAAREADALRTGTDAGDCIPHWFYPSTAASKAFGGSEQEWDDIDTAHIDEDESALLELAFVDRVLEAVAA